MDARGIYDSLMEDRTAFDAHVVACAVALAMEESLFSGRAVAEFIGLAGTDLLSLLRAMFPGATHFLQPTGWDAHNTVQDDERCLVELLTRYSTCGSNLEVQLAAV